MKLILIVPLLLGAFSAGLTSCCITHVVIKDEARQRLRFSSATSAQTFYDAYLAVASPTPKDSLTVSLLPYWKESSYTDNVHFNEAARTADTNHNRMISDTEAKAYAVAMRKGG